MITKLNPLRSLRLRIGYAIILLTMTLSAIFGFMVSSKIQHELEVDIKNWLSYVAHDIADDLDRFAYAHYIGLRFFALEDVGEPPEPSEDVIREALSVFQSTYPAFAWVGVLDASGRVRVATDPLTEGEQIFDVLPLDTQTISPNTDMLLYNQEHGILLAHRFDMFVPLYNEQQALSGAVYALLKDDWLDTVIHLDSPLFSESNLIILDNTNEAIIGNVPGPKFMRDLAEQADGTRCHVCDNDGETYLLGIAYSETSAGYPGLGWTVIIREALSEAMNPAQLLQTRIWQMGLLLSIVFSIMGWLLSGQIFKPLDKLAEIARRIRQHDPHAMFPRLRGKDEVALLANSLRDLMNSLKEQQEARQLSEDQFATIFRESLDVILVLDGETQIILSANPIIHQVLGYAPDETIGMHFGQLFPQQKPVNSVDFTNQIKAVGVVFKTQPFVRKDGTVCPMDLIAAFIPWREKKAILVTLRDVSEREIANAALEKADSLKQELEQERAFIRIKESFISMVSHEFRTPLTVIASSASIIQHYNEKLTEDRKQQHLDKIQSQTRYLTGMMDDMLVLSKAQTGHLQPQFVEMEIKPYCDELLQHIYLIDENQHQFDVEYNTKTRLIFSDPTLLRHILFNLLSNAIKYSPVGTIIRFSLVQNQSSLILTITDQGIGIPHEEQEKLFTPFHRANNVGTIKGTGLGLSIVKESVDAFQGEIAFTSQKDEGTTFRVRLPLLTEFFSKNGSTPP